MQAFSHSSRDEDDEEALKWAALEKLPTFDRLRKGILLGSRGESDEVDVAHLGLQEKKKLIDRLVRTTEEDNEKFLLKFKNRIDTWVLLHLFFIFIYFCCVNLIILVYDRVGIDLPTIEVRFENIKIEAEAYAGSRALPTFINFFSNILEVYMYIYIYM